MLCDSCHYLSVMHQRISVHAMASAEEHTSFCLNYCRVQRFHDNSVHVSCTFNWYLAGDYNWNSTCATPLLLSYQEYKYSQGLSQLKALLGKTQQYNSEAICKCSAPTPEAFHYLCGFAITIVYYSSLPTEDAQAPSEKARRNSMFLLLVL